MKPKNKLKLELIILTIISFVLFYVSCYPVYIYISLDDYILSFIEYLYILLPSTLLVPFCLFITILVLVLIFGIEE